MSPSLLAVIVFLLPVCVIVIMIIGVAIFIGRLMAEERKLNKRE